MTVTQLITEAFVLARSRYPEIHKAWISTSGRLGGLLPSSLFMLSLQRAGDLDMVLRCMEDDYVPSPEGAGEDERPADLLSGHYQLMLSELWIGAVYEIFRLLIERKLTPDNDVITGLAHHLRLLRIPLEKHEIAADKKLSGRLCHAVSGLRSRWRFGSQGNEENRLSRLPLSARDHPADDLAVSPVHTEPT
jgi:hypothetical protein